MAFQFGERRLCAFAQPAPKTGAGAPPETVVDNRWKITKIGHGLEALWDRLAGESREDAVKSQEVVEFFNGVSDPFADHLAGIILEADKKFTGITFVQVRKLATMNDWLSTFDEVPLDGPVTPGGVDYSDLTPRGIWLRTSNAVRKNLYKGFIEKNFPADVLNRNGIKNIEDPNEKTKILKALKVMNGVRLKDGAGKEIPVSNIPDDIRKLATGGLIARYRERDADGALKLNPDNTPRRTNLAAADYRRALEANKGRTTASELAEVVPPSLFKGALELGVLTETGDLSEMRGTNGELGKLSRDRLKTLNTARSRLDEALGVTKRFESARLETFGDNWNKIPGWGKLLMVGGLIAGGVALWRSGKAGKWTVGIGGAVVAALALTGLNPMKIKIGRVNLQEETRTDPKELAKRVEVVGKLMDKKLMLKMNAEVEGFTALYDMPIAMLARGLKPISNGTNGTLDYGSSAFQTMLKEVCKQQGINPAGVNGFLSGADKRPTDVGNALAGTFRMIGESLPGMAGKVETLNRALAKLPEGKNDPSELLKSVPQLTEAERRAALAAHEELVFAGQAEAQKLDNKTSLGDILNKYAFDTVNDNATVTPVPKLPDVVPSGLVGSIQAESGGLLVSEIVTMIDAAGKEKKSIKIKLKDGGKFEIEVAINAAVTSGQLIDTWINNALGQFTNSTDFKNELPKFEQNMIGRDVRFRIDDRVDASGVPMYAKTSAFILVTKDPLEIKNRYALWAASHPDKASRDTDPNPFK